jgi:hypothetical protein
MIQNEGRPWIGCRYNPPIIWYPLEGYQSIYEIRKKEEDVSFEELRGKSGFRRPEENTSPPFIITALHVNYLLA